MNKFLILIFLCWAGLLTAQDLLKEMEVTIQLMDKGISSQPNTAKMIVKSIITDLRFESNRGIVKVEKNDVGKWTLTLHPGNQRIDIKANGYSSYSERFTFERQKAYECKVKEKSEQEFISLDEDLFEVSFQFNVSDVSCSFNEFASNLSNDNIAIFKLPAGEYTFNFTKNSYKPVSQTINITEDKTINIKLEQDARYREPYRSPGIAIITTNPANAEIILDGQKFGYTPKSITGISEGEHRIEIIKNKYHTEFNTFTIKEGESKYLDISLCPLVKLSFSRRREWDILF